MASIAAALMRKILICRAVIFGNSSIAIRARTFALHRLVVKISNAPFAFTVSKSAFAAFPHRIPSGIGSSNSAKLAFFPTFGARLVITGALRSKFVQIVHARLIFFANVALAFVHSHLNQFQVLRFLRLEPFPLVYCQCGAFQPRPQRSYYKLIAGFSDLGTRLSQACGKSARL